MKGSSPARSLMKMRAWVDRDVNKERDDYNQRDPPRWQPLGPPIPCHAWMGPTGGKHTASSGDMVLVVDMPGMIVPLGTDIKEGDLVRKVVNRLGADIFATKMLVDFVAPRKTHLEARLKLDA
jgi:hypothetical protein